MFDYHISFHYPWYLLLLLLIPPVWIMSAKSLGALGRVRRWIVLVLRTAVMLLLILALAEVQWVRTSERLTVVYLLDQSLSIPPEHRRAMIEYVNASIIEHREKEDRAAVIVFGRDAAIEIPPFDDDVQIPPAIESILDPEHTNLSGAMRLAQASFPEDAAKRIVIVSDGNENLGDALKQAQAVSGSGIGIDVVPIRYDSRAEVSVQRLTIPSDVRRGQPFDMKVVVNNSTQPKAGETGEISGRIVLSQLVGDRTQVLSDNPVVLGPGKKVLTLREQIDSPAFYKYQVRFVPDNPDDDGMLQNNRATTFTHVRGKGQVLLIEDHENPGQFNLLAERLRKQNLEVTVQPTDRLFADMAALQPYDTVIIGDVGRERFTSAQVEMMVRNTQQMGSGLVVLGGPNSFGAGGWTNSKLEEAMPVDFQIKSAKVIPRGALAMLMHASEMARGNHWQKVIGREALKTLGPRDYCGVIHWTGQGDRWLWRGGLVEVGQSRNKMIALIDRMTPGDMPQFDPAMKMAAKGFARLPDAAIKHMIIISDGDPSPPTRAVINQLKTLKVTVSTVAVGTHGPAGSSVLQRLATATGGKYYAVKNANALPRIFQREARRVARPLIYENKNGVQPQVQLPHEMVRGLDGPLPPITGFVMTTVKENPLVEVALVSPKPASGGNNTILAGWNYGLGKAVAFTSDVGSRWTSNWTGWEGYDKLFGQIVRWSMRPTEQRGKFNVSTRVEDGKAKVVVTALDKDDEFLNFLSVSGHSIGPNLKPDDLKLRQTAPGRYVGEFPAADAGSYFLMINPGDGQAPIRTGFNVPYSSEFRDQATNDALLGEMAELKPKDSEPGKVIEATTEGKGKPLEQLLSINTFRHNLPKATSSQDAWHYVLLAAACIFFTDIFVRRVQISFDWVPPMAVKVRDRVLGRAAEEAPPEYMERLQSRKAEVAERIEQVRSDTRFEVPADAEADTAPADLGSVEELAGDADRPKKPKTKKPSIVADKKSEEESYTERLLKAKKKVWEGRDEKKEDR